MLSPWLRAAGRTIGQGLLHLIYPGLCHLCARLLPQPAPPFCDDCRTALICDPWPTCPRCAAAIGPFTADPAGCVLCREEKFAFDAVLRLGPYDGVLRQAVLRLKQRSGEALAEWLGELWGATARPRFAACQVDAVTAVPLHWRRRWSRGYNQSAALAHGLAAVLGLPCQPSWLRRIRHTTRQSELTPAQRRINVRGAFRAAGGLSLRGKAVLLVDDVMTTGTTVSEAASALRAAGAASVLVAALARAQG